AALCARRHLVLLVDTPGWSPPHVPPARYVGVTSTSSSSTSSSTSSLSARRPPCPSLRQEADLEPAVRQVPDDVVWRVWSQLRVTSVPLFALPTSGAPVPLLRTFLHAVFVTQCALHRGEAPPPWPALERVTQDHSVLRVAQPEDAADLARV